MHPSHPPQHSQTPRLAAEELWAHPTSVVERGGLLVATPRITEVLEDDRMWQVVVFVIQHDADGTVGFILNRPTRLSMGMKLGGKPLEVWGVGWWGGGGWRGMRGCVDRCCMCTAAPSPLPFFQPLLSSLYATQGAPNGVHEVFTNNALYCGGFTAQQVVHLMHGVPNLGGSMQVVPGIWLGGRNTTWV